MDKAPFMSPLNLVTQSTNEYWLSRIWFSEFSRILRNLSNCSLSQKYISVVVCLGAPETFLSGVIGIFENQALSPIWSLQVCWNSCGDRPLQVVFPQELRVWSLCVRSKISESSVSPSPPPRLTSYPHHPLKNIKLLSLDTVELREMARSDVS